MYRRVRKPSSIECDGLNQLRLVRSYRTIMIEGMEACFRQPNTSQPLEDGCFPYATTTNKSITSTASMCTNCVKFMFPAKEHRVRCRASCNERRSYFQISSGKEVLSKCFLGVSSFNNFQKIVIYQGNNIIDISILK